MERSEPALIPEWLKGSGSVNGGTAAHKMASSSLHSDGPVASKPSRNKLSVRINDHDVGCSLVSDRTTSSYFRRSSSSNGSAASAHSRSRGSFGRSSRDRDWEKERYGSCDKEKIILGDHRRPEYSDHLENIFPDRFEKDLRRSQSMITGKRGETWPRKVPADSSNAYKSNTNNSNGLLTGGNVVSSVHKAAFERDFPSLGPEERRAPSEIGRVSSPGLNTAIQSLPIGTSPVIGGDGWTSALAEVPLLVGSNGTPGYVQQAIPPASLVSGMTGLNMAETLAQGPSRAHSTTPQLSSGTQRLEELAIKQSRQLVPMTPSMPKTLVLNPSEKSKPKTGQQQQLHHISSSHPANQSPRSGPLKSEVAGTSNVGKLKVLKPARERNGVSPTANDNLSPTSASRAGSSPVAVAPSVVGSAPSGSPSNNANIARAQRKPSLAVLEKKLTPQAQSRNDFFNLMRKKSMTSPSSEAHAMSPLFLDECDGIENGSAPAVPRDRDSALFGSFVGQHSIEEMNDNSNGNAVNGAHESLSDRHQEPLNNGQDQSSPNAILRSEEEEAAFLRSLGWEENEEEDEGLTEEEISSFCKEYIKLRASSGISQEMQPKFLVSLKLCVGNVGGGSSSGPSSSDTLN